MVFPGDFSPLMLPTLTQNSLIILFGCILCSLLSWVYIFIVYEYLEEQEWVPPPLFCREFKGSRLDDTPSLGGFF